MIILFVAVAAGILFGTVLLWLSGYYSGQAISGASVSETLSGVQTLQKQLETEQKRSRELQAQLADCKLKAKAPPSPPPQTAPVAKVPETRLDEDSETEIARLTSEVTRLEGEKDKALFEVDNLKEELESVQEKLSKNRPSEKPMTLPKPKKRESAPHSESEALDELQAKLDMEKVAHQLVREDLAQVQSSREQLSEELSKTKRELEQVKKLAALQMSTDKGKDNTLTGSRFKTMALGMRSPAAADGADKDKWQSELDKSQSEKERLETELQRTKKELQLLKMRSGSSK